MRPPVPRFPQRVVRRRRWRARLPIRVRRRRWRARLPIRGLERPDWGKLTAAEQRPAANQIRSPRLARNIPPRAGGQLSATKAPAPVGAFLRSPRGSGTGRLVLKPNCLNCYVSGPTNLAPTVWSNRQTTLYVPSSLGPSLEASSTNSSGTSNPIVLIRTPPSEKSVIRQGSGGLPWILARRSQG